MGDSWPHSMLGAVMVGASRRYGPGHRLSSFLNACRPDARGHAVGAGSLECTWASVWFTAGLMIFRTGCG